MDMMKKMPKEGNNPFHSMTTGRFLCEGDHVVSLPKASTIPEQARLLMMSEA